MSEENTSENLLHLTLPHRPVEELRRSFHDYQAAIRTLRYLAQKALPPDDAAFEQKKQSLDKHLARLDKFQDSILQPLFHQLVKHEGS